MVFDISEDLRVDELLLNESFLVLGYPLLSFLLSTRDEWCPLFGCPSICLQFIFGFVTGLLGKVVPPLNISFSKSKPLVALHAMVVKLSTAEALRSLDIGDPKAASTGVPSPCTDTYIDFWVARLT